MTGELTLSPFAWARGFIDMGALFLVSEQEALLRHDLHEFQDGTVLDCSALTEEFVDLADGGGAAAPEDGEDFEFGVGWAREIGCVRHLGRDYY